MSELFEIGWRLFNSASFTFQISAGFPPLCMMFNLTFPFWNERFKLHSSPSYRGQWWLGLSKPDGHWAEGEKVIILMFAAQKKKLEGKHNIYIAARNENCFAIVKMLTFDCWL